MKATILYDTGDTSTVGFMIYKKQLHFIRFRDRGEYYILGRKCLAQTGIIKVTQNSDGKILWALNPKRSNNE